MPYPRSLISIHCGSEATVVQPRTAHAKIYLIYMVRAWVVSLFLSSIKFVVPSLLKFACSGQHLGTLLCRPQTAYLEKQGH